MQGESGHPGSGRGVYAHFNAYNDIILQFKTDDLSGSQPTKGNIRGGLTTIEEKAFGNLQKIGKKTYGKCELCKKGIAHKRLDAEPYARLCLGCKKEEEEKKEIARRSSPGNRRSRRRR